MIKYALAGMLACTAMVSGASAATLIAGTNHLDEKVFSTGTQNATTITGKTKPSGLGVSFTSTSQLQISGQGYAQIDDGDKDNPFDNLKVYLTSSPDGFTALEFSVMFSSKVTPSNLTIGYELLSGGPITWFSPVGFPNDGLQDWQVLASGSEVFKAIYLKSDDPMKQVKHFDITGAGTVPTVPEPATWLTMIAGFGMVGYSLRRRGTATQIA